MSKLQHTEVVMWYIIINIDVLKYDFQIQSVGTVKQCTRQKCGLLEYPGAVSQVIVSNMNILCVTYTVACSDN